VTFRRLTEQKAKRVVEWFQDVMGIQDWAFNVEIRDDPPAWVGPVRERIVGMNLSERRFKTASIWISPSRCKKLGEDQTEALVHELLHTTMEDVGIEDDSDDDKEFVLDRLSSILSKMYNRKGGRG